MNMEAFKSFGDTDNAFDGEERARKRRRWIIIGAVAAILLILVVAGFAMKGGGKSAAADKAKGPSSPHVTVVVPGTQTITSAITATGSLAAQRDMPVGVAGEGGMVTRVLVEPGDWVRQGQTLAVIERSVQVNQAGALAAQINVASADAKLAQAQLDRAKALVARGFISKADIDQRTATRDAAMARVRVAQAQLGESRARLGRLNIASPAAGLVLTRNVEAGQIVGGQGVLFRVAENGTMELQARLAEQDMAALKVGSTAMVTPVGSPKSFAGRIRQLSPVIDLQTRQGIVKITLPNDPAIRPGGFASVRIEGASIQAPLLPESAVQSDARGSYVYVVGPDNTVQRRDVKVGGLDDRGAAIVGGLAGNERVVLSAGAFLNPGDKVIPDLQRNR